MDSNEIVAGLVIVVVLAIAFIVALGPIGQAGDQEQAPQTEMHSTEEPVPDQKDLILQDSTKVHGENDTIILYQAFILGKAA